MSRVTSKVTNRAATGKAATDFKQLDYLVRVAELVSFTRAAIALNVAQPEASDLPLILQSRPNAFRMLVEREMNAIGRQPHIALEVDGLNAILSLVKEGIGHAVLPIYTMRTITAPRIMSELMLVCSARRANTETQKWRPSW